MQVPVVEYPEIVRQNLPQFEAIFSNKNQIKHFCEYVTGLIVGDKATIQAINDLFLNNNDQSALNKFLTQASWDETELNRCRVMLERKRLQLRPVSASAGRLILDDTLAHHTKCGMAGLAYLLDHAHAPFAATSYPFWHLFRKTVLITESVNKIANDLDFVTSPIMSC